MITKQKTHFCETYMGLPVEVNLSAKWTHKCEMSRFQAIAVVVSPSEWAVAVSTVYCRVMYFEVKNAEETAGLAASAAGGVVAVVTDAVLSEWAVAGDVF